MFKAQIVEILDDILKSSILRDARSIKYLETLRKLVQGEEVSRLTRLTDTSLTTNGSLLSDHQTTHVETDKENDPNTENIMSSIAETHSENEDGSSDDARSEEGFVDGCYPLPTSAESESDMAPAVVSVRPLRKSINPNVSQPLNAKRPRMAVAEDAEKQAKDVSVVRMEPPASQTRSGRMVRHMKTE